MQCPQAGVRQVCNRPVLSVGESAGTLAAERELSGGNFACYKKTGCKIACFILFPYIIARSGPFTGVRQGVLSVSYNGYAAQFHMNRTY